MKPYTYYLYHIPTGKKYYGVRLAPKAEPEQDLWIEYFGSSKKVDELIEKYGKKSFIVEVRKIFDTKKEAFIWEQKVIRKINAVKNPNWLNQSLANGPFYHQGPHTEKSKQKMRKPKKTIGWWFGKKHSEETRKKMRNSAKIRKSPQCSDLTKEKIRKGNLGKIVSLETRHKMSVSKIGTHRIFSNQHRKALSEARRLWWIKRNGKIND